MAYTTGTSTDHMVSKKLQTYYTILTTFIMEKHTPGSAIARFLRASEDGKNFLIIHTEANAREVGVRTIPGVDRIIQVGFCLLDSKFNFMESGEITVNPNPDIITPYASALTGIPERKSKR